MATARETPYVWATWVSKLMAGEAQCEWSLWFRAHYAYDRRAMDFNLARWTAEHGRLVRDQAVRLRSEGYDVRVENQNAFKIHGRNQVVLAGKPDLVAARDGVVHVVDCKTGASRVSDHMQVLIYMLILPYVRPLWKGLAVQGCLQYRHDRVAIPAHGVDAAFRQQFRQAMDQIGGAAALMRQASYAECQFCDISRFDCPDRIDTPPADVVASAHDLF